MRIHGKSGWRFLTVCALSVLLCGPAQAMRGLWTSGANLLQPRYGHVALTLPDGRVFVAGGQFGGTSIVEYEIYDPSTDQWEGGNSLAESHYGTTDYNSRVSNGQRFELNTGHGAGGTTGPTAEVLSDGRVMIISGAGRNSSGGSPYMDQAEICNPTDQTIAGQDPYSCEYTDNELAQIRYDGQSIRLLDGRVLVGGGYAGTICGQLDDFEIWNPATNLWSTVNSTWDIGGGTPRFSHRTTFFRLPGGEILAAGMGGLGQSGTNCDSYPETFLFNPSTETWSRTGDLNVERTEGKGVVFDSGRAFYVGGRSWETQQARRDAELYDPLTGQWSAAAQTLATHGQRPTLTLLDNGEEAMLLGGLNGPSVAEFYSEDTDSWTRICDLVPRRFQHASTRLADGRILVTGGRNPANLDSVEILDMDLEDTDCDRIPDDNGDGINNPCTGGNRVDCDDNCRFIPNNGQEDDDSNGVGNVCDNGEPPPPPGAPDIPTLDPLGLSLLVAGLLAAALLVLANRRRLLSGS